MRVNGIRQQTILVALIPILVMTLLFGSYSIYSRLADADRALLERASLIAHHLAGGSEYGLFSGNIELLKPELKTALMQRDVVSAVLLDANGKPLLAEGKGKDLYAALSRRVNAHAPLYTDDQILVLFVPVQPTPLNLEEPYEMAGSTAAQPLGAVMLEISKDGMKRQKQEMLLFNILVMLVVLLLSMFVALWSARRISNPILSIALIIHKIGEGKLSTRIPPQPAVRELNELAENVNKMAQQLSHSRDTLEMRIQQATHDLREKKMEAEQAHNEARSLNEKLSAALNELETIIEANPDILYVFNTQGKLIKWNSNFEKFFGLTPEQLRLRTVHDFFCDEDQQAVAGWLEEIFSKGDSSMEAQCPRHDGALIHYLCNGVVLRNLAGEVTGFTGTGRDITERREAAERMRHMAHYDTLTDLPNRALFADRLQQALASAQRYQTHMALMFVDLDLFKHINDTLGHHIGDLLLQEVARRMLECVRSSDTVARIGGDEFVVLLNDIATGADALLVAETIRHTLCQPLLLEGHAVDISSSIGIALYPDHASSQDDLINHADTAMYAAKESGRNIVKMYTPQS